VHDFDELRGGWVDPPYDRGMKSMRALAHFAKIYANSKTWPSGLNASLLPVIFAGLLIASFRKQDERVNLSIRGSGHYSQALVDAHPGRHRAGLCR
jgi:hypothetical protein